MEESDTSGQSCGSTGRHMEGDSECVSSRDGQRHMDGSENRGSDGQGHLGSRESRVEGDGQGDTSGHGGRNGSPGF